MTDASQTPFKPYQGKKVRNFTNPSFLVKHFQCFCQTIIQELVVKFENKKRLGHLKNWRQCGNSSTFSLFSSVSISCTVLLALLKHGIWKHTGPRIATGSYKMCNKTDENLSEEDERNNLVHKRPSGNPFSNNRLNFFFWGRMLYLYTVDSFTC